MNRPTVAGVSASGNYYKRGRLPRVSQRYPSVSSSASVRLSAYLAGGSTTHLSPLMTRPRVPDDKRQRTARACDSCKRRKQKVSLRVISHIFLQLVPKGIGPFGLAFFPFP